MTRTVVNEGGRELCENDVYNITGIKIAKSIVIGSHLRFVLHDPSKDGE